MEALFIYLLKSGGILAIFFLSYKLWLQKETFFSVNRHYLLAGILTSLLMPFIVFTSYNYVEPLPLDTIAYSHLPNIEDTSDITKSKAPFNWYALLFNSYILGVVVASFQFLIQLFSLFRLIQSGNVYRTQNFKLVKVKKDISPFSFFNYIVYNPDNFLKEELDIILKHEKAHAKQYHTLDILTSKLFLIVQWFNPLVWLYRKSIHQNLEFLADKIAINNTPSKKNYQQTLLKASISNYHISITNNFYNSLIKKRIIMLNQSSSKKRNIWKYSITLPALALFIMSFNTKTINVVKEPILNKQLEPITQEYISLPISSQVINDNTSIEAKSNKTVSTSKKETETLKKSTKTVNDIIAKITKNSTLEELKEIEKNLQSKGIDFSFSKIDFNSKKEITSIKLKYSDVTSGNSGSYHVDSGDNKPIKTIYIYKTDKGGIGIGNSPDGRDLKKHMALRKEHIKKHEARLEQHKERMQEHHEKMELHRSKIHEEHEKRMEEHRKKIEKHRERLGKKREEIIKEHYHKAKQRKEQREIIIEERKEDLKNRKKEREHLIKLYKNEVENGVTQIITKNGSKDNYTFASSETLDSMYLIEKTTTNAQLNSYKYLLKRKNIDFKFSSIKRNKSDEIVRIKLKLDNNKGSKASSTYNTSPDGISTIMLGQKGDKLLISSKN